MKITSLSAQVRSPDRVNVSIDGKYRFSLDISQVTDLGVKVGREVSETELIHLEAESQFGKLYTLALEYCLMRPHSSKEVRDYLYKKTPATKYKDRQGQVREKNGYSPTLSTRVLEKLQHKGYVDDEQFARWWAESRNLTKGTSLRKLTAELRAKGVDSEVVERVMQQSGRDDTTELAKIIAKKRSKYADETKLLQYLVRQGFSYDQIKDAMADKE